MVRPADNARDPSGDPPETRREVVTETLHGTAVDDPYRWLEGDDDAVGEWVAEENAYVDATLDTPTRDRLRPRIEAVADVADYGPIVVRADRYFTTVRDPEADHARLVVRDAPDGGDHVLVDPNAWPANRNEDDQPRSMGWFVPSYDGERVAVGVTEGGDENYDVRLLSVPDLDGLTEAEPSEATGGLRKPIRVPSRRSPPGPRS